MTLLAPQIGPVTRARRLLLHPRPRARHLPHRSTGRSGAGNFRSPSRDRDVRTASEQEFIRTYDARELEAVHSTGRGGIRNISGSHSRSVGGRRCPASATATRGRDRDRDRTYLTRGQTLHGPRGVANLTALPSPPPDQLLHHPGAYESSGRGGRGISLVRGSVARGNGRGMVNAARVRTERWDRGLWNQIHPHAHPHPHLNAQGQAHDSEVVHDAVGAKGGVDVVVGGVGGGRFSFSVQRAVSIRSRKTRQEKKRKELLYTFTFPPLLYCLDSSRLTPSDWPFIDTSRVVTVLGPGLGYRVVFKGSGLGYEGYR
ncbi:hypothetical protein B0H13DRAFT_2553022 [Mycena leptocephala]|nr:hypothetical protein B0H13DRAFT_2553022 [Mycena leptocephala]